MEGLKARNKGCNLEKGSCTCATFHPWVSSDLHPSDHRAPPKGGGERIRFSTRTLFLEQVVDDSLPSCRYMTLGSCPAQPFFQVSGFSLLPGPPFFSFLFFFFSLRLFFERGEMRDFSTRFSSFFLPLLLLIILFQEDVRRNHFLSFAGSKVET